MTGKGASSVDLSSSDDEETCLLDPAQVVAALEAEDTDSDDEYGSENEKYKILFVIAVCASMLIVVLIMYPSKSWSDGIFTGSDVADIQAPSAEAQTGVVLKRPNIVFITASGLGWNDVGWRNWEVRSPTLDKLAKTGGVFNWSYVHDHGSLTQAAILSGVYAHNPYAGRHKCDNWNSTLLPKLLSDAGYATHMVGMWRIGSCDSNNLPTNRGFDSFFGSLGNTVDYYSHRTKTSMRNLFHNTVPVSGQNGTFLTSLFAEKASQTIRQHRATKGTNNLFLYVSFQAISNPTDPPEQFKMPRSHPDVWNKRLQVYEMIAALDNAVGKIGEALKQSGMSDTILVFSSDSGGAVDEAGCNSPLKGGAYTQWEGGTRVITILKYSKVPRQNIESLGLFHAVDWLPTLMAAANATSRNATEVVDGLNQWPRLIAVTTRPEVRGKFIAADHELARVIRHGKYKLILGDPVKRSYKSKIMKQLNKTDVNLNCFFKAKKFYADDMCDDLNLDLRKHAFLFDISRDPEERYNLAWRQPELVKQLKRVLKQELLKGKMKSPRKANDSTV